MEKIEELFDPCKPCICSGAPCEQCMFGYKREKERIKILKEILKENKFKSIVESYNLLHNKTNYNSNSEKVTTTIIDLSQIKNNSNIHIVPATPKYTVQDDGIYIPHESGGLRLLLPKETFIEAYNKYIKGEE